MRESVLSFHHLSACSKISPGTFDLRHFLELSSWPNMVNSIQDLVAIQLTKFVVDLHEAIRPFIPSLANLLKDRDDHVRSVAISGVVKLAEHSEFD
jgi:hypothetical protein